MSTFLMFPYANHLGGTLPLVAIGTVLRERGHRVVFAGTGKCMSHAIDAGFDIEPVVELDPQKSADHINRSTLDYHDEASIARFVAEESAAIRKHAPQAVVDLHRPTLALSAHLTDTPRAVLCNTVLTRYYAGEKFLPESHPLSPVVSLLPRGRYLKAITGYVEETLFRRWAKPYNAHLVGKTAHRFPSMKDLFEGDVGLLMDAPEFAPSVALPDHMKTVGPLLHESASGSSLSLDPARATVFVYLGSYGEKLPVLVEYLVRYFGASTTHQVVVATAGLYRYEGAPLPAHIRIVDYVPASQVLGARCTATLIHGGRGSIYAALQHGVPVVGLPNQGEQEWNLDAVELLGLGRKLSARRLSYEAFAAAFDAVLNDPSYRIKAAAFQARLAAYDGAARAAGLLEALTRPRVPRTPPA